jgi:glycosyltransferase involved in cell wall biosynthesis
MPYWKKLGVKIVDNVRDCNVHFVNVKTRGPRGKPIVQRLDGIYYDSDTPYNKRNKTISATHKVAGGVIYQSEYCKDAGEYYLRKRRGPYKVVYNGIDREWAGKRKLTKHPSIVVSAKWRRHKRLPEILRLFKDFRKTYPKSVLYVMGDRPKGSKNGVEYLGHITHKKMMPYFRNAWFSLHLSKRDACPNSTVEAIGAGVPVITTNGCGGGTEMCEITEGCVVVEGDDYTIKPVPHYQNQYNVLSKSLHESLLTEMFEMTENLPKVEMPEQLTVKYMATQYVEFMKSLI